MKSTDVISIPDFITETLSSEEWKRRQLAHEESVSEMIDEYLQRRQHQHKDPVMDFLFEYYSFRPSHLKRWSPGFGVLLENGSAFNSSFDEMITMDGNCFLDVTAFPKDRISSLEWILDVMEQSKNRSPSFGCFGMHEWAMVYMTDNIRHSYLSLRMNKEELAAFVESRPLACTHFDAFRFFTDEAKPQNKYDLNRGKFADMEQPGCLHTNMDLYKWAFKMYPWISSDTILRTFELAVETRFMDMKASPYDLRDRGLEPIKIETQEGRREYVERQKDIYEKSQPVRETLIGEYRHILKYVDR